MRTAFVLSGGANLGCIQVGMAKALRDAGVVPDLVIGASAGAINAGWMAADPDGDTLDGLADVWINLRRNDVFPMRFGLGLRGFVGQRNHLVPNSGIRHLLQRHLRIANLDDGRIPLHVVVTNARNGGEVLLSTGNAVDAITASASIPGLLPPVVIDGEPYVDGGVANNTPLSHAVDLGADRIIVLPAGYACSLPEAPQGALAMAVHAVGLLVHRRLAHDVERYQSSCTLHVAPPLCPVDANPLDFAKASKLIDRAEQTTAEWIASGGLELHHSDQLAPQHGHP